MDDNGLPVIIEGNVQAAVCVCACPRDIIVLAEPQVFTSAAGPGAR